MEDAEKEIEWRQQREEDDDIDDNIQQINKAGDLSPRHTSNLTNSSKKGRSVIPL